LQGKQGKLKRRRKLGHPEGEAVKRRGGSLLYLKGTAGKKGAG